LLIVAPVAYRNIVHCPPRASAVGELQSADRAFEDGVAGFGGSAPEPFTFVVLLSVAGQISLLMRSGGRAAHAIVCPGLNPQPIAKQVLLCLRPLADNLPGVLEMGFVRPATSILRVIS
jgi:hypothetical protein